MQTKARDAKISHKNIAHAKDDFCQRTRVLSKQSTCKVFPWVCRCSFLKLPPTAHPGTTLYNTCYLTCQALPKPRKPPTQVGGLMPRCIPNVASRIFFRLWGGLRANEPNPLGSLGPSWLQTWMKTPHLKAVLQDFLPFPPLSFTFTEFNQVWNQLAPIVN